MFTLIRFCGPVSQHSHCVLNVKQAIAAASMILAGTAAEAPMHVSQKGSMFQNEGKKDCIMLSKVHTN